MTPRTLIAQKRTAAISKRKQETVTSSDSAYAACSCSPLCCVDVVCWLHAVGTTSPERRGPLRKRQKRVIEDEDEEDEDEGPAPSSGEFLLRRVGWAL